MRDGSLQDAEQLNIIASIKRNKYNIAVKIIYFHFALNDVF